MVYFNDLRYAFRLLRRSPVFTLLTVLVLSGGLGLSIFTFSFLYTAMLKPLPLSGGSELVRVEQTVNGATRVLDAADANALRTSTRSLSSVGVFTTQTFVAGDESHRRVLGATVTEATMFAITRTRPAFGRGLLPEDQVAGAQPVIVLSQPVWKSMFGADPSVIDRMITLNGVATRVIGVMPTGYAFPVASDAWVPISNALLSTTQPGVAQLDLYGRLAKGVSREQATAELTAVRERALANRPTPDTTRAVKYGIAIRSFPMAQFGDQGPLFLTTLNVLASLILLLACINVGNLLLARANERARETAVRLALGATRARLVMQSMWETMLLCLLGGALATAFAAWGLGFINTWAQSHLEGNLAFWWVWRLDRAGLIAAGVFVTVTMALLGGVVSARATGMRFSAVLRDASVRSGSRREGRIARVLVIAQVATVSVLMFFGVLTGIVARRITHLEVGYDTHNLLSASIGLSEMSYSTRTQRVTFFTALSNSLAGSAVESALLRANLADIDDREGAVELAHGANATTKPRAYIQGVLGPLSTLGITVQGGREFGTQDSEHGARTAIVSRAFAEKHWPGGSAVGQQIRLPGVDGESGTRTIVGVASNVLLGNPLSRERSSDAVYIPLAQSDARGVTILFKHRGDVVAAQAHLYDALRAADPQLAPPTVATYAEILEKTTMMAESVMRLFALCFGFALLLAVSGTYGLMARSIGRRTREIGIRRALGATDAVVIRQLLGSGGRQLGIGVLFAAPVMSAVGFGFWHFFPLGLFAPLATGVLVSGAIVSVVLLATYLPTRRVLRVPARDALG